MDDLTFDVTGLEQKEFKTGDVILLEGRQSDCVYILKDGALRVEAAGNELVKFNIPGTILGEISALLHSERTATVTAETDVTLYVIDDFDAYLESHPGAAIEIARTLATRIAHMNNHFIEVRHEIETVKSDKTTSQVNHSRMQKLLRKMDAFWGQEVFSTANVSDESK